MNPDRPKLECNDPQQGALLASYALGILNDRDVELFEQHLLHCSACQQEMEEATPSLQLLASTREEFVSRAHQEKEDFESQYVRLTRSQSVTKSPQREKTGDWLRDLWMLIWGRRWIVGIAGTVAIVTFLVLRLRPDLTPLPVSKEKTSLRLQAPSIADRQVPADSQPSANEQMSALRSIGQADVKPMPATDDAVDQLAKRKSANQESSPSPSETPMNSISPLAEEMLTESDESMDISQSERVITLKEDAVQVSPSELRAEASVSGERSNAQLTADIVLGTFDAATYQFSEEAEGPHTLDYSAKLALKAKSENQLPSQSDRTVLGDSLRARNRPAKAGEAYEGALKTDSTNVRLRVLMGVTFLAQGDYGRADSILTVAYNLLSAGIQRDDVALLLARTKIMAGKLEEARLQLENLAGITNDQARRLFAQGAIVRLDSLSNDGSRK